MATANAIAPGGASTTLAEDIVLPDRSADWALVLKSSGEIGELTNALSDMAPVDNRAAVHRALTSRLADLGFLLCYVAEGVADSDSDCLELRRRLKGLES